MTPMIASAASLSANAEIVRRPMLPLSAIALRPILPLLVTPGLPVAASRDGSLFADRFDSNLHWYLPEFSLAADVDASFAFAVGLTGQQANGQPFGVARLSLRITKQQPAQAAQFVQANPGAALREIALQNLTAVLSSCYTDQSGNPQQRIFNASSVQEQSDGSFLLVFDGAILGDSVSAVYQDLRVFGKATVSLNAGFQCWSQSPPARLIFRGPVSSMPVGRPMLAAPMLAAPMLLPGAARQVAGPAAPPAPPPWVESSLSFSAALPLNLKYAAGAYQSCFTVSTGAGPGRVILSAGDLSSFSQPQTQFAELDELGDLNLKYPSLSRAFFGVISRTIVLIPQRYAIVRGKTGCAATCLARVDSSPSSTSQCAFDFSFLIAPDVSRIELAKLSEELAGHPHLSGYQITFADFLAAAPASTLPTAFASSVQFAAGADAHSFAMTITVQDGGPNAPAVANANLLIAQFCATAGTDLIGALSLKLDDGYPAPVLAAIDLNFAHTAGSDEILAQIDESAGNIQVTNQSPLDLQLQNYAVIGGGRLSEIAAPLLLAAGGAVAFPLPAAAGAGLAFVYEAELALPAAMNAAAITKFLNFQVVDVQTTRYVVALDASGVDFNKVASLACGVTFPGLPSITPWQTVLTATLKADSSHIQIPIQNAVFTLPATINLTVTQVDPAAAPFSLTLQNDFTAEPVLVLLQSALVNAPPAPPPPPAAPQTAAPTAPEAAPAPSSS